MPSNSGLVGVNRMLLWQEYREQEPQGYSYTQFCFHLSQHLLAGEPSMVLSHQPAEKLFLDFAGKKLSDTTTGEVIYCHFFTACLPYSDYSFAMAVRSQSTGDFLYALGCSKGHLRSLLELGHGQLSVERQCALLGLSRSDYYYGPVGESEQNLLLMRLLDEQYLLTPFYGQRRMQWRLGQQGQAVNLKRVGRLMRLIGLETLYPKPNLSKPCPGHKVYPYLLRGVSVERVDQVWSTDITYIPMEERGFLYLVAVLDWYSRFVLSWR